MSARFDVKAAVAEIKNRRTAAAIVATPSIAADRAPRTVAAIAAIAGPDLEAYEERAAILEHDQGLSLADAENAAARAQGFADAPELLTAAARAWLHHLDALGRRHGDGTRYINAARDFVTGGWAEQAAALGWSELELFGLCPLVPWARLDRMGAAWFGSAVAVSATAITYVRGGKIGRGRTALGAVVPWRHDP